MTSLALLRSAVADDLERSDLNSQITTEINNAIREYSRRRFWFNMTRTTTFSTVAAQEFYGASDSANIPYLTQIDLAVLTDGSNKYPLIPVDNTALEMMDTPTMADNRPTHFSYVVDQIRLWPTPDAAYSIRIDGMVSPVDLSADGDSNVFLTQAFDVIRHSARRRVQANTLKDQNGALMSAESERAALDSLNLHTTLLTRRGGIEATDF